MRKAIGVGVGCLTLVALLGLVSPAPAQAVGPVLNHCIFTWSEAVVPTNDLVSFKIYIGTTSGGPYVVAGTVLAPSPAGGANYTSPDLCGGLPDGQKYAVVTAVNTASTESARSAEVPFVRSTTVPAAPTNLKVQ